MSYSYTQNQTFTITNAKYLASKVAADLKRIQRFYSSPSDDLIRRYEEEVTLLLKAGYLEKVAYGFKKDGQWIEPTLIYKAEEIFGNGIDDDPGRIKPGANVSGAFFTSYLNYSNKWFNTSLSEREKFEHSLPISRSTGSEPSINGTLNNDRHYFSGGSSLNRSSVKSF